MDEDAFSSAGVANEQDVALASDFRVLVFVGYASEKGKNKTELNIVSSKDVGTVALNNLIAVLELPDNDHLGHVFGHGQFPEQGVLRNTVVGQALLILIILD